MEDRLAGVVAQEEEIRMIVDEHLEREVYLTKLLQDLHQKQKVGGMRPLMFLCREKSSGTGTGRRRRLDAAD